MTMRDAIRKAGVASMLLVLGGCVTGPRTFAPSARVSCDKNEFQLGVTVLITLSEKDGAPVLEPEDCTVAPGQWLVWSVQNSVKTLEIEFEGKTPDQNGGVKFRTGGEDIKASDVAIRARQIGNEVSVTHKYWITTNGNRRDPSIIIRR